MDGALTPDRYVRLALRTLRLEQSELLIDRMLGALRSVYWRFLSPEARCRWAPEVEAARTIRRHLEENPYLSGFLRDKVLQSADPLFRAARISEGDS